MNDEDAVKNSLDNIFKTLRGSRRMLPNFAINIYNYLFEPLDEITALEIGNEIFNSMAMWDSRIEILDLLIKPDYDQNAYTISMKYKVKNFVDVQDYKNIIYKI
ncbi:MAG: GPW/gp25 family protein [Bacilli bacterium]|nr:GPW/gp25 family protein [Bacilli bacterium]